MTERPDVPVDLILRCERILAALPKCAQEDAWVGVRWRVGQATVAHLFGGADQQFRIVFRADPQEVVAFENLGEPYFRAGWGSNVVGLILDDGTDWDDLAELLTGSYLIQAPANLAKQVTLPRAGE